MMDESIEEIIWLEDPKKWTYLRESSADRTRAKGSLGTFGWKTVGYETVCKKGKGIQIYTRKVWYLNKWDAGCPDDDGRYSSTIMPVEAVKVEDIEIPEGIRIINAYEIEKNVPLYSRTSKKNQIWQSAIKQGKPFIAIHKFRDYAKFEYDMYTIEYDLKKEAVEQIKSIYLKFVDNMDDDYIKFILPKGYMGYSVGSTSGHLAKMRIFECQMLANKIKPIIENKDNWNELSNY
jgi:hypothetical protein